MPLADLSGNDSAGRPRREWFAALAKLPSNESVALTTDILRQSFEHPATSGHDAHWQWQACFDEAKRRRQPELYARAYAGLDSMRGGQWPNSSQSNG